MNAANTYTYTIEDGVAKFTVTVEYKQPEQRGNKAWAHRMVQRLSSGVAAWMGVGND